MRCQIEIGKRLSDLRWKNLCVLAPYSSQLELAPKQLQEDYVWKVFKRCSRCKVTKQWHWEIFKTLYDDCCQFQNVLKIWLLEILWTVCLSRSFWYEDLWIDSWQQWSERECGRGISCLYWRTFAQICHSDAIRQLSLGSIVCAQWMFVNLELLLSWRHLCTARLHNTVEWASIVTRRGFPIEPFDAIA